MGASSGIGYAVAEALASRGIKTGLAARRTDRLEELKRKYPENVEFESIDINNNESVAGLHKLIKKLGGMDIYFHVAGIGYDNPGLSPDREVEIIQTDTVAFARMLSAAYCYFRDNEIKGQIAAITSVAGTKGIGRLAAYSASKKFDQTYMVALEQLAHEERVHVSFTDIRPGWTTTPLLKLDYKYPLEMTLDNVVPQVIKAIVRRRRVAVIDWKWGILVSLWSFIPDCIWSRLRLPEAFAGSSCRD